MRQTPLTCSGHTRPVVHLSFSQIAEHGYFMISACKGGIVQHAVVPVQYSAKTTVVHSGHLQKCSLHSFPRNSTTPFKSSLHSFPQNLWVYEYGERVE